MKAGGRRFWKAREPGKCMACGRAIKVGELVTPSNPWTLMHMKCWRHRTWEKRK